MEANENMANYVPAGWSDQEQIPYDSSKSQSPLNTVKRKGRRRKQMVTKSKMVVGTGMHWFGGSRQL